MLILYILIFISALWGLNLRQNSSRDAALSIPQATMIKGIFVLLVFASHVSQYIDLTASRDFLTRGYVFLRKHIGQLVVVPFLFYSGYGLRCSIEKKGKAYLNALPEKRILRIYLHAVIVITCFLIMQLLLGTRYTPKELLMGYLLIGSFGNSNWYIAAILLLYLFTWFSFSVFRDKHAALSCCFVLTAGYCVIMSRLMPNWWYDTVFAFWLGLLYPSLRLLFQKFPGKRLSGWMCTLALLTIAFGICSLQLSGIPGSVRENARSILTMLLINLLLTRFAIGNSLLSWLGSHVFEFYMLQRLSMILLHHLGLSTASVPLFVGISFAVTLLLVWLFSRLLRAFDRRVFRLS